MRRPGAVVAPGVYDGIGARVVEQTGFDEAIERGKLFARAGADAIMIEGYNNLDEAKRAVDSIDAPILFNIFERSKADAYNVRELEAIGVKIIINCQIGRAHV